MVGETRVVSSFATELAAMTPVLQNHETMAMWKEIPIASVAGILDSVRSKALEFVLEIEAENPEAGTTATTEPPVPLERTDAIFYTVIFGGQNAIGPGATVNVVQGDLPGLMAYLEAKGVAEADRAELTAALRADKGKLGPRVKAWLGGAVARTAAFGGDVAANGAGGLITWAILKYLGLA